MQNSKPLLPLIALGLAAGLFSLTNGNAASPISICDLVVSTTADSGLGSLREAIQCANAVFGPNTITFAIPGAGPHVIQLVEPLPPLTDPVTIDGFSQPGSRANTRSDDRTDATLQVEIRGSSAIDYGLVLATTDSRVSGLALNSFRTAGLLMTGDRNQLEGAYVGVDATGTRPLPNGLAGVLVEGSDHLIGGTSPRSRNLVSGNEGAGIHLRNPAGSANNGFQVFGNVVGLSPEGAALGNGVGIVVENATQIQIGGIEQGLANVIVSNRAAGVVVAGDTAWASIVGNSIDNNGGLGIDLQAKAGPLIGDGVTKDDPLDQDEGPNTLQNSPILLNDITTATTTTLIGCLNSQAGAWFYIDFYSVETCDPSGRGEGRRYLGRYLTQADPLWNANFTFQVSPALPIDTYVTATATTEDGRTSEFSACRRISGSTNSPLGTLAVGITSSPNPVTVGTPLTYTISLTNLGPGSMDAVSLVNQLPAGLSNVVIKVGGNTCTIADGKVTCDFGTLAEGQVVTVVIEGIPTQAGIYVDTVTATGTSGGKPVVPATGRHETTVIDQPVLTISDTTATEGPGAQATFTLQLSRPATVPVTVTWGTVEGTAKAGTDYVASLGQTVTFQPGETSKTIQIALVDDSVAEALEQFTVHLASPTNAQIGKADGVASLTDNDNEVPLSVLAVGIKSTPNPVTVGTVLTYTISVTNLGPGSITDVSLANLLPAGLSNVVIKVGGSNCVVADDTLSCELGTLTNGQSFDIVFEGVPTTIGSYLDMVVVTGNSEGRPVVPATAEHETTVVDQPVLTISDTTATEGPGAQATFTLQLSRPATVPVTVTWGTVEGTAKAGTDYVASLGQTVTFQPGETSKTIQIALVDDSVAEALEQFTVHLASPTNAQIGKADGVASLTDNDAAALPVLAVGITSSPNPVTVGTPLTYTISLTNLGPGSMDAVSLVNQLPAGLSNVVIKVGGNTCTIADGKVTCDFGTLAEGQVVTVVIEGIPTQAGIYVDTVTATGTSGGKPVVPATGRHETTVIDQPVLTISDTTATEGPGAQATFTLQLSRPATVPVTVTWGTVEGTAKAGTDYVASLGQTVTFQPGETSKTIQIALVDDSVAEALEQFTVHLASPTNAQIGKADGVASLTDNDNEVPLSVLAVGIKSTPNPVTVGTVLTYTISVTNLGPGSITDVSLANLLPAGLSNVVIKVGGSNCVVADDTLSCELGTLTNGQSFDIVFEGVPTTIGSYLDMVVVTGNSEGRPVVPATAEHETTVVDQPVLTISDTTATEGPGAQATFTLQLSRPATVPVTVTWGTVEGTAKAGTDYVASLGQTVTFQPGETSKTIQIALVDDSVAEALEQFTVHLASPTNAQIGKADGVASLTDNDAAALPVLAVGITSSPNPVTVGTPLTYTISLTNLGPGSMDAVSLVNQLPAGLSNVVIKVGGNTCTIADGKVTCDFGTLAEGQVVTVVIEGIPTQAGIYVDTVTATGTSGGKPVVPATGRHETTVIDQPVLTISDTTATEGPGAQATFTLQLSRPATVPVTVTWGTVEGTAKAGTDYVASLGQTVTFQPGETSKTIQIALVDDSVAEALEQFTVHLASPTNAQIGKADGVASLTDNDNEVPLSVLAVGIKSTPNPVTVGTVLTYTISVTNLGPGSITDVSLANLLPAGLSNVVIKVGGNNCVVADDTLSCELGTLTNGQSFDIVFEGVPTTIGSYLDMVVVTGNSEGRPVVPATAEHETTVVDQPVLTISDTTATEGPGAEAVFTLQLSAASTAPVTVTWGTIDGSAKSGADYLGASGETITFRPGETSKTIRIPIVDDTIAEPAEQFSIRLNSSVGATLEVSEAIARISDNDESALVADIGIAELTGPISVLVGQNAVYNLTITNRGPDQMGQVFLTNNLPEGVSFVSATLDGTNAPCVVTNQQLICALGALPAGRSISLQVVLSPEVVGTLVNTFTVSGDGATDPDITNNTATINTPVREVAADDLIATFETEMKLNRQTGLLEQRIKITNNGTTPKPRVRILFNDLPAGAQIYNAAGLEDNIPFVQLNETLQPGESRELVIEYYLPRRAKIPNPRLTMRTGGGLLPQTAEGVAIDTSRTVVLSANRFLLEFPSDPGKLYQVQYSDDGAATWKRATPVVRAANSRYQWIDDGPPKTDRAPSETPMRLYRVFTVPE